MDEFPFPVAETPRSPEIGLTSYTKSTRINAAFVVLMSTSTLPSSSTTTILRQGAEAKVYRTNFLGRDTIIKDRFPKRYRHPALDTKIRAHQIKTEVRCIAKARKLGILAPALYHSEPEQGRIYMEFLDAPTIRDYINKLDLSAATDEAKASAVARLMGKTIAELHAAKIIHGDLTTSNMLVYTNDEDMPVRIALIDFGLSFDSGLVEDKAV
eukprot:g35791.t1